jgi:alpha-L-fucosidase
MLNHLVLRQLAVVFAILVLLAQPALGAADQAKSAGSYQPAPANLAARRWFEQAKFGLFVHWGVYSVPGGEHKGQKAQGLAEWIMDELKIPIPEYEQYAAQFNPMEFNAAEWVGLVKRAGMKYITITSKHHDGFAMWDSKVSDWDIVDRTPYKKDVLKLLADECRKQGIKLFFYYSHLDWHHPDYFPRGGTGKHAGRPESGDFNKYLDYMDAQLSELLGGRYGKIAGIWFDGWWDQQIKEPGGDPKRTRIDWRLRRTYDLIHKLQPQALIGNNHHVLPFEGENFQVFEKDLPGQDTAGFNAEAKIGSLPLETCETTNDSWGYKKSDMNFKSTKKLVQLLVGAAGRNANLLLNVGPMPTGKFPPEVIKQLTEMGEWTKRYGDSLYGTRGGPLPPQPWGVTTQKDRRIFVHLLNTDAATGEEIALPGLTAKVKRATLLKDKRAVKFDATKSTLLIPTSMRDEIDTVVVLDLERQAQPSRSAAGGPGDARCAAR